MGIPKLPSTTTFVGQSILLTEASAGIGLEYARLLLQLKAATLYVPVRNLSKGELVRRELLNDPTVKKLNPSATIELFELDLTTYSSVISFSSAFKNSTPKQG